MYRWSLLCFALLLSFGGVAAQQLQGGFRLKVKRKGFQAQERSPKDLPSVLKTAHRVVFYRLGRPVSEKEGREIARFRVQEAKETSSASRKRILKLLGRAGKATTSIWPTCVVAPSVGVSLHGKGKEQLFLIDPDCSIIYLWTAGKYLRYSADESSIQQLMDLYEATLHASSQNSPTPQREQWHPSLLPNKEKP